VKIGIATRPSEDQWGGDLRALHTIRDGLRALGHEVRTAPEAGRLLDREFVFLSNTCLDQRRNHARLRRADLPFGVIGFHEDFIGYSPACFGFERYVESHLRGVRDGGFAFPLERLLESPEIVHYFSEPPGRYALNNYEVMRDARVCIANSPTEERTMRRDCPAARTRVVFLTAGLADGWTGARSDEFLGLTGLARAEYILQVGRLEPRKNQLGSVLACRDLDIPLVFVATSSRRSYRKSFLRAVKRYRRARTLLVCPARRSEREGPLEIVPMPRGGRLSENCLRSAYQNAGLHLHPAFHERPGYTVLESVRLGIPTVASRWTPIRDYFEHGGSADANGLVDYVTPHHLAEIEQSTRKLFGRLARPSTNAIFSRTAQDVAAEMLRAIAD
jgi:glycosyltransferase involved in cell wall biosynthesis